MSTEKLKIDRLIIAERAPLLMSGQATVSIGTLLTNGVVHWGVCLPVSTLDAGNPTVRRLVDLCEWKLSGQQLIDFRHHCHQIRSVFPKRGQMPLADSVRGAIEKGLLAAIASSQRVPEHKVMIREYELEPPNLGNPPVSLTLVMNDFETTAASVRQLLSYRPQGIGYRVTSELVAESIGADAEYLVDFIRELSQLVRTIDEGEGYYPSFFLSLNGAIGRLAEDPVRNIGKILTICRQLEDASGEFPLILEDAFIIDESLAQAANYGRFKKLLMRAPRPNTSTYSAKIVVSSKYLTTDSLHAYVENRAVDGIVIEPLVSASLDEAMTVFALAQQGRGVDCFLSYSHHSNYTIPLQWITTMNEVLLATSCRQFILSDNCHLTSLVDSINHCLSQSSFV